MAAALSIAEVRCAGLDTFVKPALMESRPQEFHPQPLAERCVSLSTHTAPIKQTRLASQVSSVRRAAGISGRPSARRSPPASCCTEPLVLPPRPGNQRCVDMPVERSQSRRPKPPVIRNPPTEDWIEFRGDVLKAKVRAITEIQAARLLAHRRKSRRADRRRKAGEQVACPGLHAAGPELIPKESKLGVFMRSGASSIFAVDNLGLRWMHLKAAFRKPRFQRKPNLLRLLHASTVHEPIVCIPTPGSLRIVPRHPDVGRIVQEEIG